MATWRCPNCRTVQVEASRCFLCDRSVTSCGTCIHFRRSFVGGLGYCAIDRQREPLTGAEQRPCWTDSAGAAVEGLFVPPGPDSPAPPSAGRGLIELP